jgi:succinate dehydrogenase/fumarate reductase-like Fe-S protein
MRLRIERPAPDGGTREAVYDVPDAEGLTVLDALSWVREHTDPSLAMRFSCRSANACKECLAMVDGERRYTCTTPAVGEISVAPLPRNLIRDLVTRM